MPGGPLEVGYGVSYLSIAIPVLIPHMRIAVHATDHGLGLTHRSPQVDLLP